MRISFETRLERPQRPEIAFRISQIELRATVRKCRSFCDMELPNNVGSFGASVFIGFANGFGIFGGQRN
jgi:hypothetical protein